MAHVAVVMSGLMRGTLMVSVVAMLLVAAPAQGQTQAQTNEPDTPAAASTPQATEPAGAAPAAKPDKKSATPAKVLFGAAKTPAPLAARAIGNYARGCLAGAQQLAVDGPAWQAMRLSRNRNWGHPRLVALLERFAADVRAGDGWPGLLVGDISQPRGGPMLTGHASHQIGLDADIWLTPMPDRRLTEKEREDLSATSMLAEGGLAVNPQVWTAQHVRILRRAASYGEVERVLVHPAIKKAMCEATAGEKDRAWLGKLRPIWGHHFHFHIRIACPPGVSGCVAQAPIPGDDGCGKELEDWYKLLTAPPKPRGPPKPDPPPVTLAGLPADCRTVLEAPAAPAKN